MGYKPKQKNKLSNFAFPTPFKVDYARPIYDDTISQVTYNTPSYGSTLAPVIDSAKTSSSVAPVVTAPISTVSNPASLDNYISSNAYSNRAAYYEGLGNKIKETVVQSKEVNPFQAGLERQEAETMAKSIADAKAISDAKAKADAEESLRKAKADANKPSDKASGNVDIQVQPEVDSVTPVAKAKSSNAMLYIGVIAIGIVGLMLLKNK